jgi:hypothetical protein
MPPREESTERFEWALAAEQGRYAEAMRRMAEVVREEFSSFSSPPEQDLREKLVSLDAVISAMADLSDRIERLRMVAQATRLYVEASDENERERARVALLLALEELDRHVPAATFDRGRTPTSRVESGRAKR